jgi:hypothetical protein
MAVNDLPARPNLEQYKKQAKELLESYRSGDADALRRVEQHHVHSSKAVRAERGAPALVLADAQLVIAREHGFESWPKFAKHIAQVAGKRLPAEVMRLADRAIVAGDVPRLEALLGEHREVIRNHHPSRSDDPLAPDYESGEARRIIASAHHFDTWEQFEANQAARREGSSLAAQFEAAVDAIVDGDMSALDAVLERTPDLIRTRSMRVHHAMLLHYVAANGVEWFRQRTPKNAVAIAQRLLDAGAEVDAVADMYGGSTTLGLVATSIHPQRAGLQDALIDLLLAHGARMDRPGAAGHTQALVISCLANGRGEAAELLASRGAPLDLEGAAGVGRLDIVRSYFDDDGSLKPTATTDQMRDGFTWACEFGRTAIVDLLLDRGVDVGAKLPKHHGQTGLHWAAFGGHADTVKTLLERGAPVDVTDERYGTTPLGWAVYAWSEQSDRAPDRYYDVVAALVMAGATVKPEWLEEEKVRADPRMRAALGMGGTMA